MKRYLPFIIVIVVGLATVAGGIALYQAKRPAPLKMSEERAGESTHIRGPANAPVTLEEFGDFQCPPCGMLAGPIRELEKQHEKNLRVIYHHFPLVNHQHAPAAAWAAEAAGLQGRFWEMHDALYSHQSEWSKATDVQPLFNNYAKTLGLDVERFEKDMASEKVKERVASDQKYGASLGVQNTPTLFLNNRAIEPSSLNPASLKTVVEAAIKEKTSTPNP